MNSNPDLTKIMRNDWNRRVRQDYRFWMSDGFISDQHMWSTGERDFLALTQGIPDLKQKKYLEVGCGVGRLLKTAYENCAQVVGIDISEEAIEKAKNFLSDYPQIKLEIGDGVTLSNFKEQEFDLVGVFASLSSAPAEVLCRNLIEINRVLRIGGIFRFQLYIGKEQLVGREDTLHLRCYNQERFTQAVQLAGFEVEWIKNLELDVEVSYESIDVTAKIASLKKCKNISVDLAVILEALLSKPEFAGKTLDGEIEYWMSLNLAENCADHGDSIRAKEALNYALSLSKTVSIDVSDILDRITSKIDKLNSTKNIPEKSHWDTNLDIIKKRFPKIYSVICQQNLDHSLLKSSTTCDGPVFFYQDTCLDHANKPISAAKQWVKRSLIDERIQSASEIVVVGLGGGYQVEELLSSTNKKVSVVEPDINTFLFVLRNKDLSLILNQIESLNLGDSIYKDTINDQIELLVRPYINILFPQKLAKIKEQFYGVRGLKSLKPNIVVVGPFHGGTLPITGYTFRALAALGQRVREIDMSPFNDGYMSLSKILKEPMRIEAMYHNYVECVSQAILESAIEKKTDIVIFMAQAPVTARVLQELRRLGIITVLWFMEDYLRFTYWQKMAPFYDFIFTIQKGECIDLIKKAGASEVYYLPVACDPGIHSPRALSKEEKAEWGSPISFVGAGYHNRQQVFASFAELPFKLWGTEWPNCKPFDRMLQKEGKRLNPDEYTKIFCATDININLHSSNERDGVDPFGDFVNPRTFELASCGAFQLVDQRTHLSELFEIGKEIITFSDTKDLKEKINYYLQHPKEREQIAQASRQRVLKEHTYAHRIQQMLSIIYSSRYEHLKSRSDAHPWKKMLERTKNLDPQLHEICTRAFALGEEPKLDGLIADIMVGQGKLTETEQKLLFLHHVSKQIIRMKQEESGK